MIIGSAINFSQRRVASGWDGFNDEIGIVRHDNAPVSMISQLAPLLYLIEATVGDDLSDRH